MTRVLLVDDDPDWRLLVRMALEADPNLTVVGEAGDGCEAVEVAAACKPELILLDCSMPRADAFDGLPGLRAAAPGCPVILLSGHDPRHLQLAARSAGALGYLRKDLPPSQLPGEVLALARLVGVVESVLCTASTTLAKDLRSAGAARRFISDTLEPWRLGTLLDTVVLLASELVANAIVHAGSDVDVAVQLTERSARIEVTDRSGASPELPDTAEDVDLDETSGRGLWMVEVMARDWGVQQLSGGGKTIWFELDRDPDPDPDKGRTRGRAETGGQGDWALEEAGDPEDAGLDGVDGSSGLGGTGGGGGPDRDGGGAGARRGPDRPKESRKLDG